MLPELFEKYLSPQMRKALIEERLGIVSQDAYRTYLQVQGFLALGDEKSAQDYQQSLNGLSYVAAALELEHSNIVEEEEKPHGHHHR